MKIVSQSADRMVLQEGSTQGMVVGVVFVIAGVVAGFILRGSGHMAIWIALAMVLIGAGIVCFASSITVDANKTKGQIVYLKKRLVGAKTTTYSIADVLRIETRKQWKMEDEPSGNGGASTPQRPVLVAQSVIVFQTGKELPLAHQKTSSRTSVGSAVLMSGQGKETAMANRFATFLGVPFEEIAPPSMGMNMGGGVNIQF